MQLHNFRPGSRRTTVNVSACPTSPACRRRAARTCSCRRRRWSLLERAADVEPPGDAGEPDAADGDEDLADRLQRVGMANQLHRASPATGRRSRVCTVPFSVTLALGSSWLFGPQPPGGQEQRRTDAPRRSCACAPPPIEYTHGEDCGTALRRMRQGLPRGRSAVHLPRVRHAPRRWLGHPRRRVRLRATGARASTRITSRAPSATSGATCPSCRSRTTRGCRRCRSAGRR